MPAAKPPDPRPAVAAPVDPGFSDVGGIEVIEVGGGAISAAAEEAAIYYANGLAEQAIATLRQSLREHPQGRDVQPWLMLLDLYQVTGRRQAFDELALEFVVAFERSAPIWEDAGSAGPADAKATAPSAGYFALPAALSALGVGAATRIVEAAKGGALRLDAAKVQAVDPEGSGVLLEALQRLRKGNAQVSLMNAEKLLALLRPALSREGAESYWALMFELYECLGLQAEFEDLAVDYAVTYEVSPPSWEPRCPPPAAAEPAAAVPEQSQDVFRLEGVISGGSEAQMKALLAFAAERREVAVDMSGVLRVDFVSVGLVLNTMIELHKAGRKVGLWGVNEMVQALFQIMGINQFAALSRRKPR